MSPHRLLKTVAPLSLGALLPAGSARPAAAQATPEPLEFPIELHNPGNPTALSGGMVGTGTGSLSQTDLLSQAMGETLEVEFEELQPLVNGL